jgi:hypothetical protein
LEESFYMPSVSYQGKVGEYFFPELLVIFSIPFIAEGPAQPSYPMGNGTSFPGGKAVGFESDHSPPSSAMAKIAGAIPPLPHASAGSNA